MTLIRIAERFINLDRLVFAQWDPGADGAKAKLTLFFEPGKIRDIRLPSEARDEIPLNMTFYGENAEAVRDKLNELVDDVWQLPAGDKGFWPKLPF